MPLYHRQLHRSNPFRLALSEQFRRYPRQKILKHPEFLEFLYPFTDLFRQNSDEAYILAELYTFGAKSRIRNE